MARIFTINFDFRGASHAAIVSTVKSESPAEAYQITLLNEDLRYLAPDGIIRLYMAESELQHTSNEKEELVQHLKKAVSGYLHNLSYR